MPTKLRKTRKKRGSRTHGYGRVGQHRRGSKGGRRAGRHKEGWTYVIKHEPDYFGKKGFKSLKGLSRKINVINVGELEELASRLAMENQLERKGKKVFLDLGKLGYDKLLGMGNVTKPIVVKIASHSEEAAKKVEEAGGQILEERN